MRTSGVWYVSASGNTEEKHFPSGVSNGWLQIYAFNGEVKQLFYRFGTANVNDSQIFVRTFYTPSQSWSNWVRLITNTDLQTEQYMIPQPTPGNIFKAFDIWGCRLYKSGKIVTLRLNCGCEMVASSDEHILFNLPEKYKPADDNIIINYITQKGLNMMISIKNNGEFRLFNNNQTVPKNDWLLRQCITYVTN